MSRTSDISLSSPDMPPTAVAGVVVSFFSVSAAPTFSAFFGLALGLADCLASCFFARFFFGGSSSNSDNPLSSFAAGSGTGFGASSASFLSSTVVFTFARALLGADFFSVDFVARALFGGFGSSSPSLSSVGSFAFFAAGFRAGFLAGFFFSGDAGASAFAVCMSCIPVSTTLALHRIDHNETYHFLQNDVL
jgi:hypothetical protein